MNEKEGFKELQKGFRDLVKRIEAPARPARGSDVVAHVERAVQRMPATEAVAKRLEELRAASISFIREARDARHKAFQRYVSEFVRAAKDTASFVQEIDDGWRLDELELKLKPSEGKAQILYNRQPITVWRRIQTATDLEKLLAAAKKSLDSARIDPSDRADALWEAYRRLADERGSKNVSNPDRVPIVDLYRAFRLALVRRQLEGRSPGSKLQHAEFPMWAFCHNLDLYRSSVPSEPKDRRIGFESGSQREVASRKTIVLGGLDGERGYRHYAYARKVPASS